MLKCFGIVQEEIFVALHYVTKSVLWIKTTKYYSCQRSSCYICYQRDPVPMLEISTETTLLSFYQCSSQFSPHSWPRESFVAGNAATMYSTMWLRMTLQLRGRLFESFVMRHLNSIRPPCPIFYLAFSPLFYLVCAWNKLSSLPLHRLSSQEKTCRLLQILTQTNLCLLESWMPFSSAEPTVHLWIQSLILLLSSCSSLQDFFQMESSKHYLLKGLGTANGY